MHHRWRDDFGAFLADMGECPVGLTLDRIDPNGDYEPSNCRWASRTVQSRNRRNVHIVEYAGERVTLPEAVERSGLDYQAVYRLVVRKQRPFSEALRTLPPITKG